MTSGTAASFDRYVSEHRNVLVRYAALLCGSRALGEDLVQEVLVRLYPRWGRGHDSDDAITPSPGGKSEPESESVTRGPRLSALTCAAAEPDLGAPRTLRATASCAVVTAT